MKNFLRFRGIVLITVLIIFTVVAGTVFAGGAKEKEAAEEHIRLVFWGGLPPENGPQALVDRYNELNPNVTVEYVRYVNNDQGNVRLDTALMAGEQIDVFTSYGHPRREQRVAAGMAADITDLLKKEGVDLLRDFGPGARPNIVNGRVYSVPTIVLVRFLAVNKDMFDKAGIPLPTDWTLDEFIDIARRLTHGEGANKVYGIIGDYNTNINLFLENKYGTDPWLNKAGNASLWTAERDFRRAFEMFYNMMYRDKSMMAWEDVLSQRLTDSAALAAAFFNGRSAMMQTGSYMLRNIKDPVQYPRNFTVGFVPCPRVDKNQPRYIAPVEPHDDMMVNPRSKYKEEAVKFIAWYAKEGFDPMIPHGRLPLYQGYDRDHVAAVLAKGAEKLVDPVSFAANVIGMVGDTVIEPHAIPNRNVLDQIFRDECEAYYLRRINLDTLLQRLQTQFDEILASGK